MNRIEKVFSQLGLSVLEERIENDFLASHLVIEGPGGEISSGSGKGVNHKIGAKAESIEHFLTQTALAEVLNTCSTHTMAQQPELVNDGIIQSLLQFGDCKIPVISLRSNSKGSEEVLVPHVLLNPDLAESSEGGDQAAFFLSKYSSNSGTAFGLTPEEALLHALMESIERHTQSMLFLALLGQPVSKSFRLFRNNNSIFKRPAIQTLEKMPNLHLFACQPNGGAYFFCAVETDPVSRLAEFGAGCSLDPEFALERAITELAQCIGIVRGEELEEDRRAYELFDKLPKLRPIEIMNPGNEVMGHSTELTTQKTLEETLLDWKSAVITNDPTKMFEHCTKILAKEGFNVLQRVDRYAEMGYMARVYVPGFDRFHLIRSGLNVAPNSALL